MWGWHFPTPPPQIVRKCFLPLGRPWWIPGTQLLERRIMTAKFLAFSPLPSSSDKARVARGRLASCWSQAEVPARTDITLPESVSSGEGHFRELWQRLSAIMKCLSTGDIVSAHDGYIGWALLVLRSTPNRRGWSTSASAPAGDFQSESEIAQLCPTLCDPMD